MRWHILRTLIWKELLRHLANRGGLMLAALLVVMALLLSVFGKRDNVSGSLVGGVQLCYVDFWKADPWIEYLHSHLPPGWQKRVQFRQVTKLPLQADSLVYPPATGAIQIRPNGRDKDGPRYKVSLWHASVDGGELAPFESWFWKETHHYFQLQAAKSLPAIEEERRQLKGGLDDQSTIATAMVVFALFFVCVYLLPSLTCEERERGVLLAQALSPASPLEILAAKFVVYPLLAVGLAALLSGIYSPAALTRSFYWLALGVAAFGSLGIGLTISSLARTQRTASMGALCYMFVVTLLLYIFQQTHLGALSYLFLEYYCPRVLQAALSGNVFAYHWGNLLGAALLTCGWAVAATVLFRRYGWQ
jgi:hypothetical protein